MNVVDLILSFAEHEELPVDVNQVLQRLREDGCDDNIEFIGVDLDPEILQGAIEVFHIRNGVYADPKRYVNIYYHRRHEIDWQRFICCKELIHLLDPVTGFTNSAEQIDSLAERIGLPPEMQDPAEDGLATNIDRLAEFRAVALMMPMAARNLLIGPYRDGRLKLADVARLADIPTRYAGFAMSEVWDKAYEVLTRRDLGA